MTSFKELLKEVENGNRTGFKNGAWFPHKSAEGGTRTLAYGHKLSQEEEKGNYVVLPDGSVVDFDNRGLTDQEADLLLETDIQKHKKVAETQWNATQKTDFSSLNPMHQALLTEITFNIGTLKSGKKFGWPSLAKGILNNDTEVVKQEIMRFFTDSKGNRKPLTSRVNKIRDFVDQFEADPTAVSLEGIQDTQPVQQPQTTSPSIVDELVRQLQEMTKSPQRGSQTPSQGDTQPNTDQKDSDKELDALLDESLSGIERKLEGERKLEETFEEVSEEAEPKKWSKKDEKAISEIDRLLSGEVVEVNRQEPTPPPEEEPQPIEGKEDGSKDPIFGIF